MLEPRCEFFGVERFGEVIGGAGVTEMADLTLGSVRGDDDDRAGRGAGVGAEPLQDDLAGKIGGVTVEQRGVRVVLEGGRERKARAPGPRGSRTPAAGTVSGREGRQADRQRSGGRLARGD